MEAITFRLKSPTDDTNRSTVASGMICRHCQKIKAKKCVFISSSVDVLCFIFFSSAVDAETEKASSVTEVAVSSEEGISTCHRKHHAQWYMRAHFLTKK